MYTNQPTTLDPSIVNLTKAIRQVESGGNFDAKGASGEHGAYQFMPGTWNEYAKQAGVDAPIEKATPEQQNQVAYTKIAQLKDQGYDVGQIASIWNHGSPDFKGVVGTNKQGVHYDTPAYVNKVANAYQQLKQQNGGFVDTSKYNTSPQPLPDSNQPQTQDKTSNQPQDQSLGSQLLGRGQDVSNAINQGLTGQINPFSSLIQGAGAIAGGAGDIVNKGLELIPGVKQVEGLIGQGAGALASTPTGQSVIQSIKDWSTQHPELAGDIGAGFNIATAIPIFKGLSAIGGTIKNVALDSVSSALKDAAEKGLTNDLSADLSRTVAGRKILSNMPDTLDTIIKERLPLDIENQAGVNRWALKDSLDATGQKITSINQNELQPILDEISARQNFGQSLATLKNQAISEAENDATLREAGMVPQAIKQIEKRFEGWAYSYPEKIDLATQNRLKIGSGKFTEWGTPEGSADKAIYHALQKNIEDVANANGFENVKEINGRMAKLIKAQDTLKYLDGRAIATKQGTQLGNLAKGLPGVKQVSRAYDIIKPSEIKKKVYSSVLKRTAPDYVKQSLGGAVKQVGKKTGLLATLAAAQNANRTQQSTQ